MTPAKSALLEEIVVALTRSQTGRATVADCEILRALEDEGLVAVATASGGWAVVGVTHAGLRHVRSAVLAYAHLVGVRPVLSSRYMSPRWTRAARS